MWGVGTLVDTPLVLVVDDDDGLCEAVTAALESEGYRVVCALGIAALDLAREVQPDAILLDVTMHALDGARLSRLFRANPRTAHIPIIAMSGGARKDAPPALLCDTWLEKAFALSDLYAAVDATTRDMAAVTP